MTEKFEQLITKYKTDTESVYNNWFINDDDRLKAFHSISSKGLMICSLRTAQV